MYGCVWIGLILGGIVCFWLVVFCGVCLWFCCCWFMWIFWGSLVVICVWLWVSGSVLCWNVLVGWWICCGSWFWFGLFCCVWWFLCVLCGCWMFCWLFGGWGRCWGLVFCLWICVVFWVWCLCVVDCLGWVIGRLCWGLGVWCCWVWFCCCGRYVCFCWVCWSIGLGCR